MYRFTRLAACCAAGLGLAAGVAQAQIPGQDSDTDISYTQDVWNNTHGGLRDGWAAPGMLDLGLTISGQALSESGNNALHTQVLGLTGTSISERVGDLQGLDNIEAYNTLTLFEAWYQHDFGDSGVNLRLGVQDYNALFNALDSAGVFINSSFGIDPTISQTGLSIFPTTGLGGVLRWQGDNGMYAMGGVYDGVPGLPGHPAGTHVELRDGDGTFTALETGYACDQGAPAKIALGAWYRTSEVHTPDGRPIDNNHGVYLIGESRLVGDDGSPAVDGFIQLGTANADRNNLNNYIGAGINVTGLISSRPDDVLGVAVARAHTSDTYRRVVPGSEGAETAWELTYAMPVNEHFLFQPDLQYIVNPGADSSLSNALVMGARFTLSW